MNENRTEQNRTEQNRTEQNRTEQNRTEQNRTEQNYDELIAEHYKKVAEEEGIEPTSTMADNITREKESRAILDFVGDSLRIRKAEGIQQPAKIMDVGCGNGYTLELLSRQYPEQVFVGIEKSEELLNLAASRFKNIENVSIIEGDIRNKNFSKGVIADVLICQRVLINLLNEEDQKRALNNIVCSVKKSDAWHSGGTLLFIESFMSALTKLNEAREEFELPAMEPAHHNLYLQDDFFKISELITYKTDGCLASSNFLSTHYFVTRVLHPIFVKDKPFKRNSEFVKFFTHALKESVGDYSHLKLYVFERA